MLSDRIIQFRTYNNIEPETVAKVLNIDLDEYLKFEDGSATPDISLISELAKMYKVTINPMKLGYTNGKPNFYE